MFTRDKDFYRRFFSLFATLALQNIVVLSVNLADNIMLGAYRESAVSGVATANQIHFLFTQLIMACGDAAVVLGSQYWGQNRPAPVRRIGSAAMCTGLALGLIFFLLTTFWPRQIIGLFTEDPAILDAGVTYLALIRFTYPVYALTNTALAALRSVETVRIAFRVSLLTLAVNCSINYLLISGHWGAPELGVTGAAIGTLAARLLELSIVLIYLFRFDRKLSFRPVDLIPRDRTLTGDYLRTLIPFLTVGAMFGASTALQTVVLGHMASPDGADLVAASSTASTMYQVLKVAAVGASSAAAILIGKAVGAGREEVVRSYARTLQVIFLCVGVLTSAALLLLHRPLLSLYSEFSPETYRTARDFILVLCVTCIGTAYQMPVLCGIVRGGGDASFVLKNDLISIWGIVLPLSFAGAFLFGFPPVAVFFCLNADQVFKCGAAVIKCNRFRWMKKLTRAKTEP